MEKSILAITDKDLDGLFSMYEFLRKNRNDIENFYILFEGEKTQNLDLELFEKIFIFDLDFQRLKKEYPEILNKKWVLFDHHENSYLYKEKYKNIVCKRSSSTLEIINKDYEIYGKLADNPFQTKNFNLEQIIYILSVSNTVSTVDNKLLKQIIRDSLEKNYSLPQFLNVLDFILANKIKSYEKFFREKVEEFKNIKHPIIFLGYEEESNKLKNLVHLIYYINQNKFPYIFALTKENDGYIVRIRTNNKYSSVLINYLKKRGFKIKGRNNAFGFYSNDNPISELKEALKKIQY